MMDHPCCRAAWEAARSPLEGINLELTSRAIKFPKYRFQVCLEQRDIG
jgi:hypothetical protein